MEDKIDAGVVEGQEIPNLVELSCTAEGGEDLEAHRSAQFTLKC